LITLLGWSFYQTTASATECGTVNFETPRVFDVGGTPGRIALDDFNRDGKPDMAVTSPDSSYVAVFLGDGTGNFSAPSILAAGAFSVPVSTGDFNQDGKKDLAVGSHDGYVWIYLGDGSGGFTGPSLFQDTEDGGDAYDIAVGDFNQDGKTDLAIGHLFTGLDILLGNGTGGFSSPIAYLLGEGPVSVETNDFNNDGKTDLLTSNAQGGNTSILIANGSGGFTVSDLSLPSNAVIGDFNSDAKSDLLVGNADGSNSLFLGDGLGGFTESSSFAGGIGQAVDLNGDGRLDLIVGSEDSIAVRLGNGTGGFTQPSNDFPAGSHNVDVVTGDLNNDGKPDVITANYFSNTVSVLLNSTVVPVLAINPLFDTSKAWKIGKTIPIKLQVVGCGGNNLSTPTLAVTAFDLRLVGGATAATVVDSGNANPDYNFRYIGDTGGSYIFNLSTKGLSAGTYALAFYVGSNHSSSYAVRFEVK